MHVGMVTGGWRSLRIYPVDTGLEVAFLTTIVHTTFRIRSSPKLTARAMYLTLELVIAVKGFKPEIELRAIQEHKTLCGNEENPSYKSTGAADVTHQNNKHSESPGAEALMTGVRSQMRPPDSPLNHCDVPPAACSFGVESIGSFPVPSDCLANRFLATRPIESGSVAHAHWPAALLPSFGVRLKAVPELCQPGRSDPSFDLTAAIFFFQT